MCVYVCVSSRVSSGPNAQICTKKGMNKVSTGKKKRWRRNTNSDETRRDVISTHACSHVWTCKRRRAEFISSPLLLWYYSGVWPFLLLPLSHNTLASSDAFIMWYFVSFCSLPRSGFHFYAVRKRQDLWGVHKHVHVRNLLSTGKRLENRFLWQHQSNTDLAINLDVTVITKSLHELMIKCFFVLCRWSPGATLRRPDSQNWDTFFSLPKI